MPGNMDCSTEWLRELGLMLDSLAEVFGDRLNPRATELYVEALADLSVDEMRAAAAALIRNHQRFYPTPAEIRAAVPQYQPLCLEAPEHRPFAADAPRRQPPSPEAVAEVADACNTIRRILAGRDSA